MKWQIRYCNDVGTDDEAFWEWWTVEDDERSFRCEFEADAVWLVERLNAASEASTS